ncbi:MAG: S41 family peptidase [Bacteroidota bacterium]
MIRSICSIVLIILFAIPSKSQRNNQKPQEVSEDVIERLQTFAKLYGSVKYFHPSDEAAELDWDAFAIYGAKRIIESGASTDFISLLEELFDPIAPTMEIIQSKSVSKSKIFFSKDNYEEGSNIVRWIHIGDGQFTNSGRYKSYRETIPLKSVEDQNIEKICIQINKKQVAIIPTVLQINEGKTIPLTDGKNAKNLEKLLGATRSSYLEINDKLYFAIGNIVNAWSSVKYFYPYFSYKESIAWNNHLIKTLESVLTKSEVNTSASLSRFLSFLNDAHIKVGSPNKKLSYPGVSLDMVENQVIVEYTNDDLLMLKGAKIKKVDGEDIYALLQKELPLQSFGVKERGDYMALRSLMGKTFGKPSAIEMELPSGRDTTVTFFHWESYSRYNKLGSASHEDIDLVDKSEDLVYLNLTKLRNAAFKESLQKLKSTKSYIIDLRGYPTFEGDHIENFIGFFMNEIDTADWLFIPRVSEPRTKKKPEFQYNGSNWKVDPSYSGGDSKIYVLINHKAISYAESILGYFKNMENVVLVGSPTAGANGDVNRFKLPGGYTYRYTGTKVLKHDGSRLHGIGFLPDIEVRPTIKGIIEGRDEVLEKAIELAKASVEK